MLASLFPDRIFLLMSAFGLFDIELVLLRPAAILGNVR